MVMTVTLQHGGRSRPDNNYRLVRSTQRLHSHRKEATLGHTRTGRTRNTKIHLKIRCTDSDGQLGRGEQDKKIQL